MEESRRFCRPPDLMPTAPRLLRTSKDPKSPSIQVAFDQPPCGLILSAPQTLLSGTWTTQLEVDGQPITSPKQWEEVLWYEDADVAYLELDADLGKSWRLQRHVLLARLEGFAILADAILGPREGQLSYTTSIPLSSGISFEPHAEGNEGRLVHGAKRFLTLPLRLPEWRIAPPCGELACREGQLVYSVQQRGRNLFAPVLIPLVPRGKVDYTWRALTVAENLEIMPADAAFASRIQVGDRQWALYRALSRGNRTFLGKNLVSEFYCGVFHKTGEMDCIMEVE